MANRPIYDSPVPKCIICAVTFCLFSAVIPSRVVSSRFTKLKELAEIIKKGGLIEPIVVRPKGSRYEVIAGEGRLRAVREYTELKNITALIIKANDLEAWRISAAENLQREDLSAIEMIEANVEIVDAELIEDVEYSSMGRTPVDQVKAVLGRLNSIISSKNRGSQVSKKAELLLSKFTQQLE